MNRSLALALLATAALLAITAPSVVWAQGYGCEGGSYWDSDRNACSCPSGSPNWDNGAHRCVGCSRGAVWNGSSCACAEPTPLWDAPNHRCISRCDEGSTWDDNQGQCVSRCPEGQVWAGSGCSCPQNAPSWSSVRSQCEPCPSYSTWNGSQCACNPDHPEWHPMRGECWACPRGATFDGSHCQCQMPTPLARGGACLPCDPGFAFDGQRCSRLPRGAAAAQVQIAAQPARGAAQTPTCQPGATFDAAQQECVCQMPTPVFRRRGNVCEACPPGRAWDGRRCRR